MPLSQIHRPGAQKGWRLLCWPAAHQATMLAVDEPSVAEAELWGQKWRPLE